MGTKVKKDVKWEGFTAKDKLVLAGLIGAGTGALSLVVAAPFTLGIMQKLGLLTAPAFAAGGALAGMTAEGIYEVAHKYEGKLKKWFEKEGHIFAKKLREVV